MECEYCKQTFKNKGILKNHQQTAKYCLNIRNELNNKWQCQICDKILTSKQNFELHNDKCWGNKTSYKQKEEEIQKLELEVQKLIRENELLKTLHENELKHKDKEIKQKEDELLKKDDFIYKLQEHINELAKVAIKKDTYGTVNNNQDIDINNNNNNSNNKTIDNRVLNMLPLNLTQEKLIQTLEEKFNENYLMKGQKGVAEFMLENILIAENEGDKKYLMKCTDPARKVFITLDEKGKVMKDVNAENLTKMISDPVKEQSFRIFKQLQDRFFQLYQNTGDELEDDDEEKKDLDLESERLEYATNKVGEISRLKNHNGEFVRNLIPTLSS